jgi:hypothetical protein
MQISKIQGRVFTALKSKIVWAVAAVMLALIAIFPLDVWAEAAEWHHALQHIIIFMAGTVLGSTFFSELFSKKEREL